MKTYISARRKYLPRFFLFVLVFLALLCVLLLLGSFGSYYSPSSRETALEECRAIVIIDAGHGGEDGGAVGVNGVYEKDLNLKIALLLEEWLRAEGIPTVLTRSEDILLYDKTSNYLGQKKVQDLAARRKIAEQYENAVLVSIHMNAFPESKYAGLQVYYSQNDATSRELASEIQSCIQEHLSPENTRKIKAAGENIYLLDRLQCPAVLVECGFLSNPEECERLSNEAYQKKLTFLLSRSIVNYLNSSAKNLP